jgi:hypothetical protein
MFDTEKMLHTRQSSCYTSDQRQSAISRMKIRNSLPSIRTTQSPQRIQESTKAPKRNKHQDHELHHHSSQRQNHQVVFQCHERQPIEILIRDFRGIDKYRYPPREKQTSYQG